MPVLQTLEELPQLFTMPFPGEPHDTKPHEREALWRMATCGTKFKSTLRNRITYCRQVGISSLGVVSALLSVTFGILTYIDWNIFNGASTAQITELARQQLELCGELFAGYSLMTGICAAAIYKWKFGVIGAISNKRSRANWDDILFYAIKKHESLRNNLPHPLDGICRAVARHDLGGEGGPKFIPFAEKALRENGPEDTVLMMRFVNDLENIAGQSKNLNIQFNGDTSEMLHRIWETIHSPSQSKQGVSFKL